MRTRYQKKFLKDLSQIPSSHRKQIEEFSFAVAPHADSLKDIRGLLKLKGNSGYY